MKISLFVICITSIFFCGNLFGQQNSTSSEYNESRENLKRATRFSADGLSDATEHLFSTAQWVKDSEYVNYKDGDNICIINSKSGKIVKLFTSSEYVKKIAPFVNKKIDKDSIRFYINKFKDESKYLLECKAEGVNLYLNIKDKKFYKMQKDVPRKKFRKSEIPYWQKYCADSTHYIFCKGYNVYMADVTKNRDNPTIVQLTKDGENYFSFSSITKEKYSNKPKSIRGDWFKDSRIAYSLRKDTRKVREMTVVNSVSKIPEAKNYKFELSGDKYVSQYEISLFYADSMKTKRIDISRFKDQEVKLLLNYNRSVDYDAIYFTRVSRTCDTLQLCALNPYTTEVMVIAEESQTPIINDILHSCSIVNGGDDIIWWSERAGKGGLYRYNSKGVLKNKIIEKDFIVERVHKIDSVKRTIIFSGYGYYKDRNPYHKYYFSVGFDGRNFKILTPSDGHHEIKLSNDGDYFIDKYSSVDMFNKTELRSIKGKLIKLLPEVDCSKLFATGWKMPTALKLKADDKKVDLYGVMYKPHNFDPKKKYPIIFNIYPGPQTDLVPTAFTIDDGGNESLAQLGFIVINIGLRGSSPLRGNEFYTFGHGNLRDYALKDCVYCLKQLGEKYSFIDLDRVGIYGHSGGGFFAATAIMTYPDIFKVAVAASGNHDNNIYAKFWGEKYNGVKQVIKTNKRGIQEVVFESKVDTNIELVKNLRGKLFLITGEVDDNVHPANTMRLADALIKSNKRFDMQVMPRLDHGMYGKYYDNLIRYYFEENLKKLKPFNIDIINHD